MSHFIQTTVKRIAVDPNKAVTKSNLPGESPTENPTAVSGCCKIQHKSKCLSLSKPYCEIQRRVLQPGNWLCVSEFLTTSSIYCRDVILWTVMFRVLPLGRLFVAELCMYSIRMYHPSPSEKLQFCSMPGQRCRTGHTDRKEAYCFACVLLEKAPVKR